MKRFGIYLKEQWKSMLAIVVGASFSAVASNCFYAPNKLVGGGVTGVAVVLYHTLGVPLSVTLLVLNALLFVAAFFVLGKERMPKLIFGTAAYIVMTQAFSYFPCLVDDLVLAAVFGGVLDGMGLAVIFLNGGNTGGNDILAMMLQKKMKHLGVGRLIMAIDGVVIVSSLIVFRQMQLTLYGLILVFISTFVIDLVIEKMNISKIAFIITENGTTIADGILEVLQRGVTVLPGKGAYENSDKQVLMCAMKDREMPVLQSLVEEIDPCAFTIFSEAKKIHGNGFKVYK